MNVVVLGKRKFIGPSSWEEITPKHFLQLLNWRVQLGGEPAGRFVLLQLWYGIRYRDFRLLSDDDRVFLLSHLDFLDQRPERWMLPQLRVNTRLYVGPGDGLEQLTFAEFMYAQAARDRFMATGLISNLSDLAAALYRSKAIFWQKAGDAQRSLFDSRRYDLESRNMSRLPETVLQGILMNYEGCLDRFPEQFEYLFKSSSESESEGGTWLDVGLGLARQTGALGTFAELERSNLFLVLTMLDAIMKENAELKAKLDKHD